MNIFIKMVRRFRQKKLFAQIFKFLDSQYCSKSRKKDYEEWILEFVDVTKAKEAKEIKYQDLTKYAEYIAEKESSAYFRNQAAKVIHRFLEYCKHERFIRDFPREPLQIDDKNAIMEAKQEVMKKLIKRKTGPLPDIEMIVKIRKLYNEGNKLNKKTTFADIAEQLSKELNKHIDRQRVWRWYHNPRIVN